MYINILYYHNTTNKIILQALFFFFIQNLSKIFSKEEGEMNREERNKLWMEARDKGITLTFLSTKVGYSISMLSKYFRHQVSLPSEVEDLIATIIHETKLYILQKVEVK
jgi:hypothetical protein